MEKGVVELPFRLMFCRASVQSIKLSAKSGLFYLRRVTAVRNSFHENNRKNSQMDRKC